MAVDKEPIIEKEHSLAFQKNLEKLSSINREGDSNMNQSMSVFNMLGQSFNKEVAKKQQNPVKDPRVVKKSIEQIKEVSHAMEVS